MNPGRRPGRSYTACVVDPWEVQSAPTVDRPELEALRGLIGAGGASDEVARSLAAGAVLRGRLSKEIAAQVSPCTVPELEALVGSAQLIDDVAERPRRPRSRGREPAAQLGVADQPLELAGERERVASRKDETELAGIVVDQLLV